MAIVIKSQIKNKVKELQKGNIEISSVAEEVETALEMKVEEILEKAIDRAKQNKRRTLHARDL
jgi:histone H3/H4